MLKIYIADDDTNIVKILKNIINKKQLGMVVGFSYDGETVLDEIEECNPDILIIDYLMPNKDGASVVKEVHRKYKNIYCIIISQVSDEEMIKDSYDSGIEYFVSKPINILEIENAIKMVKEKVEMAAIIKKIKDMISIEKEIKKPNDNKEQIDCIKLILSQIGILGEKGSYDIISICKYIINNKLYEPLSIKNVCLDLGYKPKTIKQRMRRAINIGLINIANAGIEDYMNDYFVKYSNTLFDFESVKKEMDYIRGKGDLRGSVNITKFIESLLIQSRMK
ncbi:MAG: response regulator [Firmicutes bacterium]|nr:response regulator [Bacillota bacterium]